MFFRVPLGRRHAGREGQRERERERGHCRSGACTETEKHGQGTRPGHTDTNYQLHGGEYMVVSLEGKVRIARFEGKDEMAIHEVCMGRHSRAWDKFERALFYYASPLFVNGLTPVISFSATHGVGVAAGNHASFSFERRLRQGRGRHARNIGKGGEGRDERQGAQRKTARQAGAGDVVVRLFEA